MSVRPGRHLLSVLIPSWRPSIVHFFLRACGLLPHGSGVVSGVDKNVQEQTWLWQAASVPSHTHAQGQVCRSPGACVGSPWNSMLFSAATAAPRSLSSPTRVLLPSGDPIPAGARGGSWGFRVAPRVTLSVFSAHWTFLSVGEVSLQICICCQVPVAPCC